MPDVAVPVGIQRPATLTEEDDVDLVSAVRRGDDQAFERLYSRYHRRIGAYVRGMVKDHARAEDVTQEVFLSALRRLRASDQSIVLKPWLYEIARNACIDQYRRTQRAPEVLLDGDSPESDRLVAFGPTPDVAVDTKQTLDHLRHAFHGLSDVQHEILVMRELEGRSYREIGERMNLTRPAVESALFRARRRLLEEYEDLSSGSRCIRIQSAINSACTGSAGVRERWRIASHVTHCQVCRRHARVSGLAPELASVSLPARVAAVLPLPAFLRRTLFPRDPARVAPTHAGHVSGVMGWAGTVSSAAEPLSGWITAGAAAATVALAIGSAHVIGNSSAAHHRATPLSVAPAAAVGHTSTATHAIGQQGTRSASGRAAAETPSARTSTPAAQTPAAPKPHGASTSQRVAHRPSRGGGLSARLHAAPPPSGSTSGRRLARPGVVSRARHALGSVLVGTPPGSPLSVPFPRGSAQAVTGLTTTVGHAVSNAARGVVAGAEAAIPPPLHHG